MTRTVIGYPGVSGKRADGVTIAGIVPQFDGSPFGPGNCGACSEAHRNIAQQRGIRPAKGSPWYPTGASIRRETGDTSGGLMPSQTQAVVRREYGIATAAARVDQWADMDALLWLGYTIDILVTYGPIDDFLSGSPGFRKNHRLNLAGIRELDTGALYYLSADSLYDGRRAGIPRGPHWLPASVIRTGAGLLEMTPGRTVNEIYGGGKAYFIPSLTRWVPSGPPPIPSPTIVSNAPAPSEVNPMLAAAYGLSTARVQRLAKSQPLFKHPGGPVVTRMAREGDVGYISHAGGAWGAVLVTTGAPYSDGKGRPTGLYVPTAAGPIRSR